MILLLPFLLTKLNLLSASNLENVNVNAPIEMLLANAFSETIIGYLDSTADIMVPQDCHGFLQCWLDSLVIHIPDQHITFPTPLGDLTIDILQFTCVHIHIDDFNTVLVEPTLIDYSTTGIGVVCTGNLGYHIGIIKGQTQLTATIDKSSLEAEVDVIPSNDKPAMVRELSVTRCTMKLNLVTEFSGGVIGWVLDLFKTFLDPFLDGQIKKAVCGGLTQLIDVNMTNAIGKINKIMKPFTQPVLPLDPKIPAGIVLVDWRDAKIVHTLFKAVNAVVKQPALVNCLIDKYMGPELIIHNGTTPLFKKTLALPKLGNLTLTLQNVSIEGLDTLATLLLLNLTNSTQHPANNNAFHPPQISTVIDAHYLNISIHTCIDVSLTNPNAGGSSLHECFSLDLNTSAINFELWLIAGMQQDLISNMYVGQLQGSPECLLSTFWSFNIAKLEVGIDIDEIAFIPVDAEYLEKDIDVLINTLFQLLTDTYKPLLRGFIDGVLGGPIRDYINANLDFAVLMAKNHVKNNASLCPMPPPNTTNVTNIIEWDNSPVLQKLDNFLTRYINASSINDMLFCAMGGEKKVINETFWSWNIPKYNIGLDLRDLLINHVNSIYDFRAIQAEHTDPPHHYLLDNSIGIGHPEPNKFAENAERAERAEPAEPAEPVGYANGDRAQTPFPPTGPMSFGIGADLFFGKAKIAMGLNLSLTDFHILLDMFMQADKMAFNQLQLNQVLDISCLVQTISALKLQPLEMSIAGMYLEYDLLETGPQSQHQHQVYEGANFSAKIDQAMRALSGNLTEIFNKNSQKMLTKARNKCLSAPFPGPPGPAPGSEGISWQLQLVGIILVGLFFLGTFFYYSWNPHKLPRWVFCKCCKEKDNDNVVMILCVPRPLGHQKESQSIDWASALVANRRIPLWLRIAIPTILFVNIGFFLYANFAVIGAAVNGDVTVFGEVISLGDLSAFTLQNSVHDMWQAKVYPLAILIAAFSGAWPYLKLLMMLACWVMPVQCLSGKKREVWLMALDALGKWSLIDTFVMVLFLVSFRFHVAELDEAVVVDIFVDPRPGFYVFLMATMLSLALSHIILFFHRFADLNHIASPEGGATSSVSTHVYEYKTRMYKCTNLGQSVVTVVLILAICLVVWGSLADSFSFHFTGLAGVALGDQGTSYWSVYSLGDGILKSVRDPNTFGIHWIQTVYILYVFGMPLAYLASSVVLWAIPLTLKRQRQVFVMSEVLYAWSALEVFMIAIIAALTEIGQFAAAILGDKCDPLIPILDTLGIHGGCFNLETKLLSGIAILFSAGLIFNVVGMTIQNVCHSELDSRLSAYNDTVRKSVANVLRGGGATNRDPLLARNDNSKDWSELPEEKQTQAGLLSLSDADIEADKGCWKSFKNGVSNCALGMFILIGLLGQVDDQESRDGPSRPSRRESVDEEPGEQWLVKNAPNLVSDFLATDSIDDLPVDGSLKDRLRTISQEVNLRGSEH